LRMDRCIQVYWVFTKIYLSIYNIDKFPYIYLYGNFFL
jgi:hypothetical protein